MHVCEMCLLHIIYYQHIRYQHVSIAVAIINR